jgi:hypothetical protein
MEEGEGGPEEGTCETQGPRLSRTSKDRTRSPLRLTTLTDEVAALPDPVIQRVGRVSSEIALAPRFQMRGLETISMARRSGRGPGSCLKRVWVFVLTRVYTV